jgi:hypothetical protein
MTKVASIIQQLITTMQSVIKCKSYSNKPNWLIYQVLRKSIHKWTEHATSIEHDDRADGERELSLVILVTTMVMMTVAVVLAAFVNVPDFLITTMMVMAMAVVLAAFVNVPDFLVATMVMMTVAVVLAAFVNVPDFLITTMMVMAMAVVLATFVNGLNSIVTSLMTLVISELEIRARRLLDGRSSNECRESTGEEHK